MKPLAGWLGAALFALCAVPQVYTVWTTNNIAGISTIFILMWWLGELFSAIYLIWDDITKKTTHYPIYFNYGINFVCVSYLLYAVLTK